MQYAAALNSFFCACSGNQLPPPPAHIEQKKILLPLPPGAR